MLYNTKWDSDILTVEHMLGWLRQQPPEVEYNYYSGCRCLCFQYLEAMGLDIKYVTPDNYTLRDGTEHTLPRELDDVASPQHVGHSVQSTLDTFGNAMARAEKMLAAANIPD
jgi:hypothetical protein